jgi:hypothetical protein
MEIIAGWDWTTFFLSMGVAFVITMAATSRW